MSNWRIRGARNHHRCRWNHRCALVGEESLAPVESPSRRHPWNHRPALVGPEITIVRRWGQESSSAPVESPSRVDGARNHRRCRGITVGTRGITVPPWWGQKSPSRVGGARNHHRRPWNHRRASMGPGIIVGARGITVGARGITVAPTVGPDITITHRRGQESSSAPMESPSRVDGARNRRRRPWNHRRASVGPGITVTRRWGQESLSRVGGKGLDWQWGMNWNF
jgi:hypothetical protein